MPKINLDERRALLEPTTVVANKHTYTLASGLPAATLLGLTGLARAGEDPDAASQGILDAYMALFGAKDGPQAMLDIHLDDLGTIIKEAFGVSLGEPLASPPSSKNGGTKSRQTSNGSIKST